MFKLVTFCLFCVFAYLQYKIWFDHAGLPQMLDLRSQISQQQTQNHLLEMRNHALQAEVKDLKMGHEAIEERARNDLGMIKQGETFYQIVKVPPKDENSKLGKGAN